MKWLGSLVSVAAVLSLATAVAAHPKHEHKVMGTLTAVSEHEIELETIENGKITVATTDETLYERGEAVAAHSDLQVGGRIVVFYMNDDEDVKRAVRILLPEGSGAESGEP